jgi:Sec7-like guanine-nucleotide exchange factor
MTLEQYTKLARDTKYTKDLTVEFIENIYYGIRSNEIKLPDENPNDVITGNFK